MKLLKISLRNIFRNKKRTFLTLSVIVAGIGFSIIGLGRFGGILSNITQEAVNSTGHVRITSSDYELKSKSLDVSSNIPFEEIKQTLSKLKISHEETGVVKFGGLLFENDDIQKNGLGYGIEPSFTKFSELKESIYEGNFLNFNNKDEILIGEKLKKQLNLKLGSSVTILTKTADSSISAHNYKVVGFFKFDNGKLNQSFYITLKDSWYLLDIEGFVTEYRVYASSKKEIAPLTLEINSLLGKNYEVKRWDKIGFSATIVSLIPTVQKIVILIFGILSGVTIANTMIMVIYERKREIGVMKAMGVSEKEIFFILSGEGLFLGIIGSFFGIISGGLILFILSKTGVSLGKALEGMPSGVSLKSIIYPEFSILYLVSAFCAGIIIALLATFLPALKISKEEPAALIRD